MNMSKMLAASEAVPDWVFRIVITAVVTAAVAGIFGWGSSLSARVAATEKDTAVQKSEVGALREDVRDIKQDTREIKALLMQRR